MLAHSQTAAQIVNDHARDLACSTAPHSMAMAVATLLVVFFLAEHTNLLKRQVSRKGHSRYSQTREGSLETVEAGEWAGVAPGFTVIAHRC